MPEVEGDKDEGISTKYYASTGRENEIYQNAANNGLGKRKDWQVFRRNHQSDIAQGKNGNHQGVLLNPGRKNEKPGKARTPTTAA